ncbi:ribonuclease H-like domain-containing protein [Tanacetum coccineum]
MRCGKEKKSKLIQAAVKEKKNHERQSIHMGYNKIDVIKEEWRQSCFGRSLWLASAQSLIKTVDSRLKFEFSKHRYLASEFAVWSVNIDEYFNYGALEEKEPDVDTTFSNVIVGNGSSIPVTHSGHVKIPNPYRPLHLRNVLVTPNIIKNLVSVRKFTTDNKCSIDFDPYGFTVRDYHTRQTLLRCDSTGDLYPLHVAASAFALLTNNHSLWHQRLGHPGDAVIQTLSSRGLVSYNKNTQHLCRAYMKPPYGYQINGAFNIGWWNFGTETRLLMIIGWTRISSK